MFHAASAMFAADCRRCLLLYYAIPRRRCYRAICHFAFAAAACAGDFIVMMLLLLCAVTGLMLFLLRHSARTIIRAALRCAAARRALLRARDVYMLADAAITLSHKRLLLRYDADVMMLPAA